MYPYNTLSEMIVARGEEENKGITFISGDTEECYVSYKTLYGMSLGFLYHLQALGCNQGDEVVLQLDDNLKFAYSFWACILGGMIPVPVTTGLNDEHKLKLFKIWSILKKPKLIAAREFVQKLMEYSKKKGLQSQMDSISRSTVFIEDMAVEKGYGTPASVEAEATAFIQFSSGSTGEPKGVVLTHKNLVTNIKDIASCTKTTSEDSALSWMPLTHDMGLIAFHLVSVLAGINQYLMPTTLFVKRPTLWLKKASEHSATQLYSPNFGYKHFLTYFTPDTAKDWDLSAVRIIINGAEPISIELCHKFLGELSSAGLRRNSMLPAYGLAEASVGVSFSPAQEATVTIAVDRRYLGMGQRIVEVAEDDAVNRLVFVDVGYPIENCSVRIWDENHGVLGDDCIGMIQIKGGNVTSGYYNNPEATKRVISADGWLNTGDLGFMRKGRLIITGRAKDVIFINGQNVYSHDLERVAEGHERIELGKVVACGAANEHGGDEIILFVMHKKSAADFAPLYRSLKNYMLMSTGIEVKEVVPVKKIPKTTSGKVQRYKLREAYLNNEYKEMLDEIKASIEKEDMEKASYVPKDEIEASVMKLCMEVFGMDRLDCNANLSELGASSIKIAEIHEKIEELYPGRVDITDLYSYPTVAKLAKLIQSREKTQLTALKLPEEYFHQGCSMGESQHNAFEFELKEEVTRGLRLIAEEQGVELYQVFTAMFIHLLREISENSEILVHTISDTGDGVMPLKVDFSQVADLSELFKAVVKEVDEEGSTHSFDISRIKNAQIVEAVRDRTEVTVLICERSKLKSNSDLKDAFDMLLETDEKEAKAQLLLSYNEKLLRKEMMAQLAGHYINLFTALTEQYGCKEGVAI